MKKVLTILLCAMLLLGLAACGEKEDTAQAGGSATFTVVVCHQNGEEKTFTYTSSEKYVGPVLEAEGLIEGNEGPYGMEITTVDGERAVYSENGAYWALYEGDEYALQGIDTTPIKEGQVYKLVWTAA